MTTFEVYLNGKKLCTAGVGKLGVLLSANLAWRGSEAYKQGRPKVREYLRMDIGGLSSTGDHLRWIDRKLKSGDTLTVKVGEGRSVDKPRERQRRNPVGDLRRRKQYVRRMAKDFGWKIRT